MKKLMTILLALGLMSGAVLTGCAAEDAADDTAPADNGGGEDE